MKMREVIDKVSELYRNQRGEAAKIHDELIEVDDALNEARSAHYRNINHADYEALKVKQEYLRHQIALANRYAEGISAARELLMDMGFDTEVE